MLRITILYDHSVARFVVEGKLAEPWVAELRRSWEAMVPEDHRVVVDLAGVTLIDSHGKALLTEMYLQGTQMLASGLMTRAIIEEIQNAPT